MAPQRQSVAVLFDYMTRVCSMGTGRTGYSLVEAIIVVLIVGLLTFIAVPRLQFDTLRRKQAHTVAKKIVTDLRRTRALAISDAANNTAGFRLRMIGSSPYGSFEIVNLDTSAVVDSHSIDSAVTCSGGNQFDFGPLGNLLSGSDTQLTVSAQGRTYTITIVQATGAVKCE